MDISLFWARLLGVYCISYALVILLRGDKVRQVLREASHSLLSVYIIGFISLLIGSAMIVTHPIFSSDWRTIITILGYLIFLKGFLRLTMPEVSLELLKSVSKKQAYLKFEIIAFLLLGFYLLFKGYFMA